MKNKFKLCGISAALALSMLLTGCSGNAEQPNSLPSSNPQTSVSSSQSESTVSSSESSKSEQSSTASSKQEQSSKTGSSSSSSKASQSSKSSSSSSSSKVTQSSKTSSSSSSSKASQSSKTGSSSSSSKPVQPSETPSTAEKITINDDVVWGLGKTLDELKGRYGEIKGGYEPMGTYWFEKGYGEYGISDGVCTAIDGINTSDILKGSFSVMNYKDLENRAGVSYIRADDKPDPMDDCWWAYFTHTSYNGVMFATYSQTARDQIKADTLGVRIWKIDGKPSTDPENEITINDDVVWGLGKTLDELKEKYGKIKGDGGAMSVYTFENGYGRYGINDGVCTVIDGINTSDILKGNFSVLSYKDLENRAGISYGRIDDNPDPMDECWWAFFVHPSYNGVTFAVYSQTARDEIKADIIGVRIWTK